jgi:PHP family Zn ribbon phosphoesterase
MNWRVSSLDRYRLVSSSDCHSPGKLAREACAFDTDVSYFAIRDALRTGKGFAGTIEFFPEEGKYHADGHRKCAVRLLPEETRKNKGLCPVCGRPVTVGVLNRVEELADRPDGTKPKGAAPFRSVVPLAEILSEILEAGTASKKVQNAYEMLISRIGPELFILERLGIDEIERNGPPRLAEAIARMREGRVIREAGYDGEYGAISLLIPGSGSAS